MILLAEGTSTELIMSLLAFVFTLLVSGSLTWKNYRLTSASSGAADSVNGVEARLRQEIVDLKDKVTDYRADAHEHQRQIARLKERVKHLEEYVTDLERQNRQLTAENLELMRTVGGSSGIGLGGEDVLG